MGVLLSMIVAAAPAYEQHIAAQKLKFGDAAKDLSVVVEPPFVVWGDSGELQVQRSAKGTVRWAVQHLEAEFFPRPPDGIHDIFLFRDAASYERHAKQLWGDTPS